MLQNLHVKNLALIDETEVDFRNGLNILSGETGAGKTTLAKSILRLIQWPPGRIAGGQILYEGKDLVAMEAEEICH